jgi:uncharacterized protein
VRDEQKRGAKYWIDKLRLEPHPEGGYFRQTYKSGLRVEELSASPSFPGSRTASTAIYFLLDGENFSAFHRLRSDEMWHFYTGTALEVHIIEPDGTHATILLGDDPEAGQQFQAVVKAGCWFASRLKDPKSFALVGCTVAPGFEFEDFELARREELVRSYLQHKNLIEQLTRQIES